MNTMPKQITSLDDLSNKTIDPEASFSSFDTLFLTFTDKTFLYASILQKYQEDPPELVINGTPWIGYLDKAGVLSREEIADMKRQAQKEQTAIFVAGELAELARLKAKYEGPTT